jgi:hypothetical protein
VYKGLRAWVWDIKLERFKLVPLYSIFLNSKEEDRITPVDVGILPNHVNSLCTCVIGVCSLVLSFQTCLLHKGLVGNWLPIKLPIFPTIGIRAWLRISTC